MTNDETRTAGRRPDTITFPLRSLRPLRLVNRIVAALAVVALLAPPAPAQTIRLKDGRLLHGKVMALSGVADPPAAFAPNVGDPPKATPIVMVDDDLRRTFVPKLHYVEVVDQMPEQLVKIRLRHLVAQSGLEVASVGPSLGITPFDHYGRRIYEMQTTDGPLAVVQGITLLTPRYARIESLRGPERSVVWDSRIATTSIPHDTLLEIIHKAVDQKNLEARLQVVRFFLQAERFPDAQRELREVIDEFPDQQDLQSQVDRLRQMSAERVLREVELRRGAGQHRWVQAVVKNFPTEDVSGETLQRVREIIQRYQRDEARVESLRTRLQELLSEIDNPDHRRLAEPIVKEILAGLNHNTAARLTSFSQLAGDEALPANQRVALAITGWLLGANQAEENLATALSLVTVRDTVRAYLRDPQPLERDKLLASVRSAEGATVANVAAILANMLPPLDIPEGSEQGPGSYTLSAPGVGEYGDCTYLLQVPLEYDPMRRYPLILALNGAHNSPLQELNFWAGTPAEVEGKAHGTRNGFAPRHGYITLSVDWQKPQQLEYEYSAREHAAVLTCLREACRRFSIDTDRVCITGHGMGGELAWDVGGSHPDLWAGIIPFVARSRKYIRHYWDNVEHVPLYFVTGELDGRQMSQNADVFDQYLRKRFDCTVVEYLGRGKEPFNDELPRLFDWMARKRRTDPPKEFTCSTLRPWDNFFWWVECRGMPPQLMRLPAENWDKRSIRTAEVNAKVLSANRLSARTASDGTIVWLSPSVVDFQKEIRLTINGAKFTSRRDDLRPDLEVLLEDARTRADRQRPFWAKIAVP